MAQMLALVIVVAVLFIGDMVSVRTKAWIPSVFVCAVLFLLGYWTFFPPDIVASRWCTTRRRFDDDLFTNYEYGYIVVTSTTEGTMENHFNFTFWNFRDCRRPVHNRNTYF